MKYLITIIFITLLKTSGMALQIKTEIIINASPQEVWNILIDFNKYPDWNPFIKSIKGNPQIDEKLTVRIKPPKETEMIFKPKILTILINKELCWLGHFLFPGLLDGKHKFEIINNANGTITFIHSEIFKGLLVPVFKNKLENNTKNGFIAMNKKLKELVEKSIQ